jgi:hypothetical protein
MSEPGPNWAHLGAQASYEQAEASVRLLAMQTAAFYRALRQQRVPTPAALALTLQWQDALLAQVREMHRGC